MRNFEQPNNIEAGEEWTPEKAKKVETYLTNLLKDLPPEYGFLKGVSYQGRKDETHNYPPDFKVCFSRVIREEGKEEEKSGYTYFLRYDPKTRTLSGDSGAIGDKFPREVVELISAKLNGSVPSYDMQELISSTKISPKVSYTPEWKGITESELAQLDQPKDK
ncbi:MAG TPA: hypothetical protein DDX47_06140 [Candidatus Jacksonbacteria bacterium]|nr:MAG: hypothetical protein UW45_C0008G0052 [Parcubacteria group bacterium GW2011_GWC2_44_22]OGY76032.1 MAG: hypothetical protein A2240_05705 [Candidatus Jacksonbacteria bacterium RIFOXYA2_FULL_43_12]OGY76798.1 MAG: hypothetical protein A2295_00505 [Candidatus Jacksonbacteria bacterium RIFOXYB2_FULL_44_15]OGY82076.1 MAG: hypothetical protein A2550_00020 [Candidatus Jacksonbacteria bacterium RIFOXYD2_FULL_43_21]HBH46910.1 hypothetical protein [Candidatus Jacksonbacteria bacterium]